MISTKLKYSFSLLVVLGLLSAFFALAVEAAPDFNNQNAFRQRWLTQDNLVGTAGVSRPYTWGPNVPGAPVNLTEAYTNSPGGQRAVLYLDKARMEINNPANGYVTTGLAVKELVSGKRQDGDTTFVQLAPSQTQVAGDPVSVNPNGPVYASFKNVVTLGNTDGNSRPSTVGATLTQLIAKNGAVSSITPPESLTVGAYEAQTGHNIAKPFQDFKFLRGPTTDPATGTTLNDQPLYTDNPTSNVFGLAISEPYWVNTKVAGQDRMVLVQLFERRVLTYNPALPGAAVQKVEMGNLGQHYYQWRYVENKTLPTQPPATTPGNGLDAEENNFVSLLNQYRQSKGMPTLNINAKLTAASKWLSNDMANKNYFAHTDSLNRNFQTRLADFGYNSNTYRGENIAAGMEHAQDALTAWEGSPAHNQNLLDQHYRTIGVGRAYNAGSTDKWYWVIDLGSE